MSFAGGYRDSHRSKLHGRALTLNSYQARSGDSIELPDHTRRMSTLLGDGKRGNPGVNISFNFLIYSGKLSENFTMFHSRRIRWSENVSLFRSTMNMMTVVIYITKHIKNRVIRKLANSVLTNAVCSHSVGIFYVVNA